MDSITRFCSPLHRRIAEIASLGAGDACLAGVAISLLGERFRIDSHSRDEFLGFLEVPWSETYETTVPDAVRKWLWLGIDWLSSHSFESTEFIFAAYRLEAQELAVRNRFRNDDIAEENAGPSGGVHTDFQSFHKQNIAGKQIRIHTWDVKYLFKGHLHVAVLAFDCDMDAPCADAKELSLRRVDFNRFVKGFVVGDNVFVRCEVLRGT